MLLLLLLLWRRLLLLLLRSSSRFWGVIPPVGHWPLLPLLPLLQVHSPCPLSRFALQVIPTSVEGL